MNSKKHVLFISYDGMTDPLGQSQVIPYLKGLVAYGYSITILSCEKKQVYNQRKESLLHILTAAGISWHPIMYSKNPPVLSTLWDIVKLKSAASTIHKNKKVHMVHTRPGIPSMVGLWFKKKYGSYFLNDIREFYADSRVDGGMWRMDSFVYKKIYHYFKKQEEDEVRNSDGIVCLTHAAEKIIKTWPHYNHAIPLQVIPCSVDTKLFNASTISLEQKMALTEKLSIPPETILFTYLGSIGGWYLTDEMLRFCKIISDKIPAAKFLFISPHLHQVIAEAAQKQGLPHHKLITTHAQRAQIPALLSLSNYAIFFIKPCYSKQSSSPTKHGELMSMGIPVITNDGVGDMADIVSRYNAGFVLEHFDDATYNMLADKIATEVSFNHAEIRRGAEEFYSLEKAIDKYIKMYQSILKQ